MEAILKPPLSSPNKTKTPKPSSFSSCTMSIINKATFLPPLTPHFTTSFSFSAPSRFTSSVIYATPESQLSEGVERTTREWVMQDFYALRKDVETATERVEEIRASASLQLLGKELVDLESKAADSSFWNDRAKAQETLLALTDVKDKINLLNEFKTKVEDAETIVKLTEEMDSIGAALLEEAVNIIKELNKALDLFELTQLLSGPYNKEGVVISITAGAGGTDAQDWAEMLLRMYMRWGEKQKYKSWVVEKSLGEEAGIKSATIEVEGRYAYGYLSGEKEKGSQLANMIKALSRLEAKLLVIAEEQRAPEIKQIRGDAVKAEWGQRIRNYVFHPYKLVKDIRTGFETSNIASVMDGELDAFIKAYLKYKYSMNVSATGVH
ncbi:peptide chain release factor PrfB1, chloroplastic-like [Durio zibethinus]|uniref:Peptide chain release factor PrfB1, chloroplastic-like n=1 Tax=Durio zibethinus TaxID=66656 RepID=A0A6P5ZPS1_DURZI|nr:peptide chain release factor PrfB1, chloroplastic-like [Durio zibethinus]